LWLKFPRNAATIKYRFLFNQVFGAAQDGSAHRDTARSRSSRAVFAFWVKRDAPATGVGTVNVRSCVIWGWFVAFAAFIGGFLLLRNKAQHPHSVLTFLRKSDVFDRHHDFL
jgi:hypothetical protein